MFWLNGQVFDICHANLMIVWVNVGQNITLNYF
jgi:hypothetical protein